MPIKQLTLILLLGFQCIINPIFAYKIELNTNKLNINKNQNQFSSIITNNEDKPIVLEFIMFEQLQNNTDLSPSKIISKDFNFFPEKVIIMPGQKKLITIMTTIKSIENERLFYFKTQPKQIPGNKDSNISNSQFSIDFLISYEEPVKLSSTTFKEKINIDVNKIAKDNSTTLEISIKNKGNTILKTKDISVKVKTNKGNFYIDKSNLKTNIKKLYPKNTLNLSLPWPKHINQSAIIKSIKY